MTLVLESSFPSLCKTHDSSSRSDLNFKVPRPGEEDDIESDYRVRKCTKGGALFGNGATRPTAFLQPPAIQL